MTATRIAYFFGRFPWYPLTFVYHEIRALLEAGHDVRIVTFERGRREDLHGDFDDLWNRIHVVSPRGLARKLFWQAYFRLRRPGRYAELRNRLSAHASSPGDPLRSPYLFDAFALAAFLRRLAPAYLHSHFTFRDTSLTHASASLLGIPFGFTSHADAFVDAPFKMLREWVEDSLAVFASTREARKYIIGKADGVPDAERKIVFKPGGVDLERFRLRPDPGDPTRLAAICRFDPKKGLIEFARACRELLRRGHRIRAVLVGDAPDAPSRLVKEELLRYINENGLAPVFELTGSLTQEEYLARTSRCGILVSPFVVTDSGERDGVPTVILEAMAVGMVNVTTDAGAIGEVARPMQTALVVEQRNAAALADAVETLIGDPELFHRLRRNARALVERERDIRKTERLFVDRLTEALAARSSAHGKPAPKTGPVQDKP